MSWARFRSVSSAQGGELMIGEIGRRWQNHKDIMVKFTKKFFFYLDQYYTTREQLPKVYDTAMLAFKNTMFPFVRAEATTAILDLVRAQLALCACVPRSLWAYG
eukprot:SAG31_NODE_1186_length_9492_cov_70.124987_12_plen_104_part_00